MTNHVVRVRSRVGAAALVFPVLAATLVLVTPGSHAGAAPRSLRYTSAASDARDGVDIDLKSVRVAAGPASVVLTVRTYAPIYRGSFRCGNGVTVALGATAYVLITTVGGRLVAHAHSSPDGGNFTVGRLARIDGSAIRVTVAHSAVSHYASSAPWSAYSLSGGGCGSGVTAGPAAVYDQVPDSGSIVP